MNRKHEEMLLVAREYCALIEQLDDGKDMILKKLLEMLPRLHASIASLSKQSSDDCHVMDVDLDARFELFSRLHELIGDKDSYWLEYDAQVDEQCKSGSLADDLTDIYCELKNGLLSLEENRTNPQETLDDWQCGFKVHWGKHLVDAEKHLYDLQTRNQL